MTKTPTTDGMDATLVEAMGLTTPGTPKPRRARRQPARTDAAEPVRQMKSDKPVGKAAPLDKWQVTRAAVAAKINSLTTADCMRLFDRTVHHSALVLTITACPDVADFAYSFGSDVQFTMGARLREEGTGASVGMVGTVIGVERDGYVTIHAITQCNWQRGENHNLPELKPLAEMKTRFLQNSFAMSVSLEGLATTQLDRTDITMRDILDGFMLAHRGLTPNEIRRRYTHIASNKVNNLIAIVSPYMSPEDGRNPEWHGWSDVPVDKDRPKHPSIWRKPKEVREQNARGYYGTGHGQRLLEASEFEGLKVNEKADTRETLALLHSALKAVNLPMCAERDILAAIETLTVKRAKDLRKDD